MVYLRDKVREYLGFRVLFYIIDGSGDGFFKCGIVLGVYVIVDFGNFCKFFKIV